MAREVPETGTSNERIETWLGINQDCEGVMDSNFPNQRPGDCQIPLH